MPYTTHSPRSLLALTSFTAAAVLALLAGPAPARADGTPCPANLAGFRGQNDLQVSCDCSAAAASEGLVWGTGMYTDDSSVCRAAVHAGVLAPAGGPIDAWIRDGQPLGYIGSTQNGITSAGWGGYPGSFSFDDEPYAPPCPANMTAYRGQNGQVLTCECTPQAAAGGSLWGTDIYSDDSALCHAARHAGVISSEGGVVDVVVAPAQPLYLGSTQNGVTSGGWGFWPGSFQFEATGCGEVTDNATCNGDILQWCHDDEIESTDCTDLGEVCGQVGEGEWDCIPATLGFGYPVGDLTSWPAGGWEMVQVLGHFLNGKKFHGGHLAQDIAAASGDAGTANTPVHSVADGTVLYAGPNGSSYVNVVLVRHELPDETVCSFYGHLGAPTVSTGDIVQRGEQIATVLDWYAHFGEANMSHLHYVLLGEDLCNASAAANGSLVCGYDYTAAPNGITDLTNEPARYSSIGDPCGDQAYPDAFISPSQFIEEHHY